MSYKGFNNPKEYKNTTAVFYGINKGERIPDGYLADVRNMTSTKYPCIATREERARASTIRIAGEPCDVLNLNGSLMVCCTNGLITYKNKSYEAEKQTKGLVRIGNKVFAYPSGVLINEDFSLFLNADISHKGTCTVQLCDSSYTEIGKYIYSDAPETPTNGQLWYDKENKGLYKYSKSQEKWVSVPEVYIRLEFHDSGDYEALREGDAVTVKFFKAEEDENAECEIETYVNYADEAGIYLEGALSDISYNTVMISRRLPAMQYCVTHNNRVWGCFYSGKVNEIYASKLGDALNWNCFKGLSTDSYTVSCGEAGSFTGCAELGDAIVFFKENCIYTVYGTEPSNFQTVLTSCYGVQEGSEKSIVNINGNLYYKSCHGIMRLSEGALPVCISDELGTDVWKDAVAGTDGRKYYIVMTSISGKREMLVYDTRYGLWHKEEIPGDGIFEFTSFGNNLLMIEKVSTGSAAAVVMTEKISDENKPVPEDYDNYVAYKAMLAVFIITKIVYEAEIKGKSTEEIRELIAEKYAMDIESVTDEILFNFLSAFYEIVTSFEHEMRFSYVSSELSCNALLPVEEGTESKTEKEGRFSWSFETGIRGFDSGEYKRLKAVELRMRTYYGSRVDVSIEYDLSGKWEKLDSFNDIGMNTYRIRERLKKCDVYRLKVSGYGKAVVYSISDTFEEVGSVGF